MKNKGVIIAVVAIILVGVIAFLAGRGSNSTGTESAVAPVTATTESAPAEETSAPATTEETAVAPVDVPADTTQGETAPTEQPAQEPTEASATDSEGNLLAAPSSLNLDVQKMMKDRVLGKADAPVTIIEYASYTCPHCAHYANDISPEVKKQLVDTGKAKFIFREFPIDAIALQASMMARCAPEDKFFDLMEVIFKNQERWVTSEDPLKALTQYGNLAGMDDDLIKACVNSEELQNALLKNMQDAQTKYSIKATPTFVLNDGAEVISGAQPAQTYVDAVERLLKK